MPDSKDRLLPHRRITLRDIAKQADVHFTTVGLALRNSPKLKRETVEHIQSIAKKLGYTPDPMLSALGAYRMKGKKRKFQSTLAWINNWPKRDEMLNIKNFRDYHSGAAERAHELGFNLEDFWLPESGMSPKRMIGIFNSRNIQGLLIAPQPHPSSELPIDVTHFSAVCLGYSILPVRLHVITNHHFHSMKLLIDKLISKGYRRMGFIGAQEWDEKVENAWLGGLALAKLRRSPLKTVPPLLEFPLSNKSLDWWMRKHQPDVVVGFSDILPRLKKLGYSIPKEIGFASLCVDPSEPDVSGLNQNNLEIGKWAVNLIVSMINDGECGWPVIPHSTLVESSWQDGMSLRRDIV